MAELTAQVAELEAQKRKGLELVARLKADCETAKRAASGANHAALEEREKEVAVLKKANATLEVRPRGPTFFF